MKHRRNLTIRAHTDIAGADHQIMSLGMFDEDSRTLRTLKSEFGWDQCNCDLGVNATDPH